MEKEMLKSKYESLEGPEDDLKTVTLPIFLYFWRGNVVVVLFL